MRITLTTEIPCSDHIAFLALVGMTVEARQHGAPVFTGELSIADASPGTIRLYDDEIDEVQALTEDVDFDEVYVF